MSMIITGNLFFLSLVFYWWIVLIFRAGSPHAVLPLPNPEGFSPHRLQHRQPTAEADHSQLTAEGDHLFVPQKKEGYMGRAPTSAISRYVLRRVQTKKKMSSCRTDSVLCRGLQRDVFYLGWPISPSEPKNCGVSVNEYSCIHGACIAPVVWSFFIDYCTAIRDT